MPRREKYKIKRNGKFKYYRFEPCSLEVPCNKDARHGIAVDWGKDNYLRWMSKAGATIEKLHSNKKVEYVSEEYLDNNMNVQTRITPKIVFTPDTIEIRGETKITTVETVMNELVKNLAIRNKAPNTRVKYKKDYRNHIQKEFGKNPISAITSDDIITFFENWYSDKSYHLIHAVQTVFNRVFKLAKRKKYILANPMNDATDDINEMKSDRKQILESANKLQEEPKFYEKLFMDYLDFFKHNGYENIYYPLLTMFRTSARIGECLALDIRDWDGEKIRMARQTQYYTEAMCEDDDIPAGKNVTESKNKLVGYSPPIEDTELSSFLNDISLQYELNELPKDKNEYPNNKVGATPLVKAKHNWRFHQWIFPNRNGELDMATNFKDKFLRAIEKMDDKLRDSNPHLHKLHTYRKAFISYLIDKGVNPKVIQKHSRHKSMSVLLDRYTYEFDREKVY